MEEEYFPDRLQLEIMLCFLYNNQFCLIWKSENVSFNQTIKELKDIFEKVDNFITQENVNSHFKYEFKPKKIESHLTNFIVFDLETHITDRARPYVFCFYRLSKLAGKYDRDITPNELENRSKDTIAFDGHNCVEKPLDFCLKLKGEEYKDKKDKVLQYNLNLHAHNVSGCDTWTVLNNLSCDKKIVNIIKNGKGILELKVFNGNIEKNKKQIPQDLHFRCGVTHLNYFLKKLGKTFKLQKELLKTEMDHDEVDGSNYKDKKDEWLPYAKNDVLCTAFSYARYCQAMEEITGFRMKDCLTAPSLGWKYFNSMRDENDEPIYTYNDKYMRWFVRQSIKGGNVCAFNQYHRSKNCDDVLKILSEELNVRGNVHDIIKAYMKYKKIFKNY